MTPTYVTKKNVRYRYYTSSALFRGEPASAGTVKRAAAGQIEELVTTTVRQHLSKSPRGSIQAERTTPDAQGPQSEPTREDANQPSDGEVVRRHVSRVGVHAHHLLIHLRCDMSKNTDKRSAKNATEGDMLRVAWSKRPSKLPREIIPLSQPEERSTTRPIRTETRANLVRAIARGRCWLDEIINGKVMSADDIATREGCSVRQINLTLSFAFLSPALVQAAVDGQLPRGIGIATLRDMPADWAAQHRILGLGL